MLHMLQFVLHIWNTLLLAVEEIPTLQLLVCWLGGYGGWSLWFWSGGEEDGWSGCKVVGHNFTEHRLEFECRSAMLVERKMQFQSTMKEGLDHGPDCNTITLKEKCRLTNCVLLQLWNQAFNMDGMDTWGRKLLALHQLNQACTLYTMELYHELLLPLVAFTLLAHSISWFTAFWMAIIFGVHTTVCVPISPDFANGYMMFFFPALKHSPKPMRGLLQMLRKGLV